nr:type II secretion system protein GspJ [Sulfitobacter algicola]
MGLGIRLYDRSAQISVHADELTRRVRLRDWLASSISETQLVPFPTELQGNGDGFTFVTLKPSPFAPDAAALRVSVSVQDDALMLSAEAINDENETLQVFAGPLLTATADVRFSYYDAEEQAWQNDWTSPALPALVRVETDIQTTPNWPEFTVRLLHAN